ncbi:MAG TPA: hypothetical protein VFL16_01235 [Steroidobacteraceae bacterium]|nr:hypothetical protein [Steroidobacteraceae bacterium]
MRIAGWAISLLALGAAHAQAQAPASPTRQVSDEERERLYAAKDYWDEQRERYARIAQRANELFPRRRDAPLRDVNISDDEIREVQVIKEKYLPRDYVNISPVVTDCPCEEGPTCTAQVFVVATLKGRERGLQLSRVSEHWQVGVVQQWWLKFQAIQKQHTGSPWLDYLLYQKAVNDLYEEFPRCVGKLVPAEHSAAAQKPEPAR